MFLETCCQSDQFLKQHIKKEASSEEDVIVFEVDTDEDDSKDFKEITLEDPNEEFLQQSEDESAERYKCDDCGRTFRCERILINHRAKHTGELPHPCSSCDEKFSSFRLLQRHIKKFHPECENLCSLCGKRFKFDKGLLRHIQVVHEGKPKKYPRAHHEDFTCDLCGKTFTNKPSMRCHVIRHLKRFFCYCGKSYDRRCKLKYHEAYVHQKQDIRPHQCLDCGQRFSSAKVLSYHTNIHKGEKPYLCSACPLSYTSPDGLRQHWLKMHDPSGPPVRRTAKSIFLCANCGKSFSRRSHLDRHTLNHHSFHLPPAFRCDKCGREYRDVTRLRAHMRSHSAERPYPCTECDSAFKTSGARQYHVRRVHLCLRPYPCGSCNMAFKCRAHLEKHLRTHTGERPFACPLCPYNCAERSNLKKHIKIHDRNR